MDRTLHELRTLRQKDNDGNVTEHRTPTLDEALEWARGKTIVILDKKNVPVEACIEKTEEHEAEAYTMVMAYSFQGIRRCHELNRDIMMDIMIGDRNWFREFDESGVPWNRIVVFVGHTPPEDKELLAMIHAKGDCCMSGTSRNLDRQLRAATEPDLGALQREYRERLKFGVDLIETDLPIQTGNLLYAESTIPASKSRYFRIP